MKKHKKLGEVLEIKDLSRSQNKLVLITTLTEIKGSGFLSQVSDMGIIVSLNKAYFLNLKNTAYPEIINYINLKYDPMYVNRFLGFYKDYALFGIAYQGIEIIDMNDPQNPKSLGMIKEYGFPSKVIFKDTIAINEHGIFDASELFKPHVLKRFEIPVFDLMIKGNSLIYSSSSETKSIIQSIRLSGVKKFNINSTLNHEFIYGGSIFKNMGEKYLLAASGNGIGIIEITTPAEKLELKALVNLEVVPDSLIMTGKSCIVRTIPYWGHILVSFNLEDPLNPKLIFALDTGELRYFTANKEYIIYLSRGSSDAQTSEKSLIVLKNHLNSPPEFIGVVKTEMSSNYALIDNIVYVFEEDGLKLFEIQ